jgi:hypothetical protein
MSLIAIAGGSGSHKRAIVDRLLCFLRNLRNAPITGRGTSLLEVHHADAVGILKVISESESLLTLPPASVKTGRPHTDFVCFVVAEMTALIKLVPIRALTGCELAPGLAGGHIFVVVRL